ncbi:discoidin domain-containing protein [Actinoplanes sp. NPDC051513]|uniref:discoidin domain-containing protein n=1 Tax=Actinoplanes sp. NPDC051513 TaxID=3363908 RepID=UPI0037A51D1C
MEGTPTDPADVPNQRTASERAASERAASLRAVFASSPRPGQSPDASPRRPGESTAGRRPNPAGPARPAGHTPPPGPVRPAAGAVAPTRRKRLRLWLVPVVIALVALGGGAAFVATRGTPFGVSHRASTVGQDASATPGLRPTAAGVAGVPVASAEPTETASSATAPTGIAATSAGPTATKPAGRLNKSRANLALRKNVESSADEASAYPASDAVDGNPVTRWSSGFADPQWIRVDLGTVWQVTSVRLNWEHAYAIKYRVDISLDAKRWTTVYQTSSGTDGLRDIPIDPAPARYVRVYGTQRSSQYGYSLLEFEVR